MSNIFKKQLVQLQRYYPDGNGRLFTCKGSGLQLQWRQMLQPTKYSREFQIQVKWGNIKHLPEVEILKPGLIALAGGKRSPHDFSGKDNSRPCLFFNGNSEKEWLPSMFIAETIIPWTLEWLYYWELWMTDGDWRGGGVHVGELTVQQYREQYLKGKKSV